MKVLLTGAGGQLGQALINATPEGIELLASSRSGGDGLLALDLADATACRQVLAEHRPDWVLNAGAYTAVDNAETESELAHAVNGALRALLQKRSRSTAAICCSSAPILCSTASWISVPGWIRAAILWGV
jgi:dTDP-4-dehydrorhamnose reductase